MSDPALRTGSSISAATPRTYLRAMRPHHWFKNILVFLPPLLAGNIAPQVMWASLVAFVAFSLLASGVYVLNDIKDLETDRAHPRKRMRPFASGAIPVAHGRWMVPALFMLGLGIALALGPAALLIAAIYVIVTTAYSFVLKHIYLADIGTLAALYTLRILVRRSRDGTPVSGWLLAFALALFFSLAAVKRLAELAGGPDTGRPKGSGHGYDVEDRGLVTTLAGGSAGVALAVLGYYMTTDAAQAVFAALPAKLGTWGALLVFLARIIAAARQGTLVDDPIAFALRDWVSWLCLIVIVGFLLMGAGH